MDFDKHLRNYSYTLISEATHRRNLRMELTVTYVQQNISRAMKRNASKLKCRRNTQMTQEAKWKGKIHIYSSSQRVDPSLT